MKEYDDIINLLPYELKNHPRMDRKSRAAQFAPFKALTGFSSSINETGRLTDNKKTISEDWQDLLDYKIQKIYDNMEDKEICIKYFSKDKSKSGGSYLEYKGKIIKIDKINQEIILSKNKKIKITDIINIYYEKK